MAKNPNSKSQFIRKYRKLTRDPKSFFEDSDNPVSYTHLTLPTNREV